MSSNKTHSLKRPQNPSELVSCHYSPENTLITKLSLGGDIQPKRDLTRFVKWPKYIRIQRQKAVLQKRLKVPPMINQFSQVKHYL